jgi:hypothetical protein
MSVLRRFIGIDTDDYEGTGRMGFEHISDCLPAWLSAEIEERAVEGSACEALTLRSTAGKATTKTLREGKPWPSMQRVESLGAHAAMGMKSDGQNPPSLPPLWTVLTRDHGRVTMHGRAVTAATGSPIPAARPYLVTLNGARVHSDHSRRVKQIEHAKEQRHSQ